MIRTEQFPEGRILALDYGSERIGMALSDPLKILAVGAGIVRNSKSAPDEIRNVVESRGVVRLIVGMPYLSDGSKGSKALEVEEFISRLKLIVNVPVETWDESYTSVRAREAFREGGMKKKERQQKGRVDEMAARLLLQDYLDSMSRTVR